MVRRSCGFTLVELLVAIGLLLMIAVVAQYDGSAQDELRLQQAVAEVRSALRLARSETMRTGIPHGIQASTAGQRLRLYQLDTGGLLPSYEYAVYHPQDKRLFDLRFGNGPLLEGVVLAEVDFDFQGLLLPTEYLGFDASGRPNYDDGLARYTLQSAALTISYRGQSQVLNVNPANGRIQVQP